MTRNRKAKQETRSVMASDGGKYLTVHNQHNSDDQKKHATVKKLNENTDSSTKIFLTGLKKPATLQHLTGFLTPRSYNRVIISFNTDEETEQQLHAHITNAQNSANMWSFATQYNTFTYNPLMNSSVEENAVMLLKLHEWHEPYYKSLAYDVLKRILTLTEHHPMSMEIMSSILRFKGEVEFFDDKVRNQISALFVSLSTPEKSAIFTVSSILRNILMFTEESSPQLPAASIKTLSHNNAATFFMLNDKEYDYVSERMFALITQDMKSICR